MTAPHSAARQSAQRRRDALLRAAMEIAGESGAAAATHRAIAARADVPLATTSYFFSSIAELMEEATRQFAGERAAELDAVAAALSGTSSADEVASQFAHLLLAVPPASAMAQVEAYLSAARTAELRGAVTAALSAFERVAAAALRAAGARRPEEGARAFVALADGFGLQHLACPAPGDEEVLRQAFRALFIAFAMEDDERRRWDARLGDGLN
jgi:TetR/AcrR family transcriptional regulator, regulator of biofilm formation and stress response